MENCIFCELAKNPHESKMCVCGESPNWLIVEDGFPVTDGHMLLISKRHIKTVFELNDDERNGLQDVISHARTISQIRHGNADGWNIGANCGEAAGQTIPHCHIHLIPRRIGDTENPRGGVRGCIPNKQAY